MTSEASVLERTPGSIGLNYGITKGIATTKGTGRAWHGRVLVYGDSDAVFNAFAAAFQSQHPEIAFAPTENCNSDSEAEFAERVERLARTEDVLLVVSDRFASRSPAGVERYDLARVVRERSGEGKAVVALVAVIDPPQRRIRYVDHVIERGAFLQNLCDAVQCVSRLVRYKLPPLEIAAARAPAIEVRPVGSVSELRECLALRQKVYRTLNYLDLNPDDEPGDLDLNYFDPSALHFVAVAGQEIAGTARLIVAGAKSLHTSLFGGTARVRQEYGAMCEQIAATCPALKWGQNRGPTAPLPVLAAFDYAQLGAEADISPSDLCEISRVVVAEEFRGLGVSRLLVRACIAAAFDLRQRYVLLDCIPQHAAMYEKFGFARVEGYAQAWGIGQLAILMSLGLKDVPDNVAVQIAERDLEMMRTWRLNGSPPRKTLCLCGNGRCWVRGEYGNKGLRDCPRKASFMQ
jgi:predicted GNAT family N-acyltransferase